MKTVRGTVTAFRWLLVTAVFTVSLAQVLPAQEPTAGNAQIFGRVIDASTGRSLEGASVRILRLENQATTDAAGKFMFGGLAQGTYTLRVEALGYSTREDSLTLRSAEVVDVLVEMSAEPVELTPITVEVRSSDLQRLGIFDRRENEPGGYFVAATDIERRSPQFTTDVLTSLPSVRVQYAGAGRRGVVFLRGSPCQPDFYLDGTRILGDTDIDRVRPSEVAGIEVYIGVMIPIQFKTSSCGAILVWTKRGGG